MANTLTGLIRTLRLALNPIQREMVGFIPAVSLDTGVERAALGQKVQIHVVPASTSVSLTPGQLPPNAGDAVIGNRELEITRVEGVPVRWSGEETRALQNTGNYNSILLDRWTQAFRTLTNFMESDLASLYDKASRAHGTAGTAPFGTAGNLTDTAGVARILDENGTPPSGRQLVLGSAAMANMRGLQSTLFKVNEAGTDEFLREGMISQGLQGFAIRNSAAPKLHVKGTGAGYLSDLVAGYPIGATEIHVDTGTGTILPGDVVTFFGDTNKYVIEEGFAGDGDGDIVLAEPGLRQTLANDVAMSIGNNYTANLAFHRSAIVLATRRPAVPDGGDSAEDTTTVTDPFSGISFEIAVYREFLQAHYQVRAAWGFGIVKPEFISTLLG